MSLEAIEAVNGSDTSSAQSCPDVQITVRIKQCPNSRNSIISKVANSPQQFKLHNEFFDFDHIQWADEPREKVYQSAAYPFVEKALQGHSVTILAYGPTEAGKSYTMGTLISNQQKSGLIQCCLKHIFQEHKVQVSASFVEIYNKELHDLLNMGAIVHRGVALNPKIEKIKSLEEGLQLVNRALQVRQERKHSSSSSGKTSTSESHTWLTLLLEIEDGKKVLRSKINLVDLAGSRMSAQTGAGRYVFGRRSYLDESLSALSEVLTRSCSNRSDPMLSSRDSVLASIFKDLLDAKCLVSLVACISADPATDCRSTFRTLRVANNIKAVQIERRKVIHSAFLTNQLIPTTEEVPVVSPPELQNIENIDGDEKPVITSFEGRKLRKCSVVLRKSDVDLYESKKGVECKDNVKTPLNLSEMNAECEKKLVANCEAVYSAGTKSTLSISKLETQTNDSGTFVKNDSSSSPYNQSLLYCFDESLSVSSLEDMATKKIAKFHMANDDSSAFHGFPSPAIFIPLTRSSNYESPDGQENILAGNVSQLSISGRRMVNSEGQGEKQATLKSEDIRNSDWFLDQQKVLYSTATRVNKMKRMNAILTTDFSQPGPSQIENVIPRKIIKLNGNLAFEVGRVASADLDPKSEEVFLDGDYCDNMKNRRAELNDKQNVHNKNILRILNTSTAEQLISLPRVGFKTAVSIYQYRLIHGDFESLESLVNLPIWTENLCKKFFAANNVLFE